MEIDSVNNQIKSEIEEREKQQRWDGFLYNGGTVFALACTGFATIIGAVNSGSDPAIPLWVAPLLSGLATIWIGIDRALQFGQRWRFHRMIAARNMSLARRIDTLKILPPEQQSDEIMRIREEFILLPSLNPDVPGLPSAERK